jgi:outer membrane protein assembly factor BamB
VDLGEGHAGAAVDRGRVWVLDYDEEERADALRCFSLDTGRELWRRSYKVHVKRNHGMSRTVPAVAGRFVVTIGPKCHVLCADADTGDFLWGLDLVADFGAEIPLWYTGQCPLLDSTTAVLAPGGTDALMIGVDCATGRVLWSVPNPRGWKMSHASVMPMTLCGRRLWVYVALGGIVGVSAGEEDRGRAVLESEIWSPTVAAPSPVALGRDRILVTAGYGRGSALLRAEAKGGRIDLVEEARIDRSRFACEQHTPVFFEGRLFTVLPKDAGPGRGQLVCADREGKPLWSSGKEHRFGLGPYMIADGKILVLDDAGVLTLARAPGDRFELLARARVLHGRDAWAPMALAGGRLLLRDATRMVCLDLRKERGDERR